MRRFILLVFIGVFLVKNVTLSKNREYSSRLAWLFGSNNKINESKEENKATLCQSQECQKIARIITDSMDKSVDPCDDFYEYACGKWSENNPAPKGIDSWSMFTSAQINAIKQVKEIFDEGPKNDDLFAVKLAKNWYAVCTDTDAMNKRGLEPLVFTMSRLGGWPMIMEPDEWNEEEYRWQKVDDQYMRLTGRNAFHDVRVVENGCSNESEKVVHISSPHLPPDSFKLWGGVDDSEEDKDKSDEDLSDEEKKDDEQQDSQEMKPEPRNENKDNDKNDNSGNNDDKDDNNNDDDDDDDDDDDNNGDDNNDDDKDNDEGNDEDDKDNDDNENDVENDKNDDENDDDNNETNKQDDDDDHNTNEQNDDEKAKKKVSVKKTGKFAKNKKLRNRKIKSSTYSKKHYKTKKERVKRRAIPTNVHEKLYTQKNGKKHVKQVRTGRVKETLETQPQISIKEPIEDYDIVKEYTDYISKVARAIAKARGVEVSEKHMNKDIQDMINFHVRLTGITTEKGEEEELTLNDFQEWYEKRRPKTINSAIDWLYKIGELFDEAHAPVDGDLNLKINKPNYFKNLVSLLDDTSSRTIVNYIHWNFLSKIIKTTTNEMRKLYNTWEGKEKSDDGEILGVPTRSFKCAMEVNMADILAYEYVRKHFSDKITTTASDMMDDIQKEVEYQIKESDWMDENTKDFVLTKLIRMEKFIGYPDWYRNNTIVKRYYQGLIIGNSYYENTLSFERYSKWKGLRKLLKEDEDDNDITAINPVIVNAFFSPDLNSIALTAADFQSPLFAFGRPQAINYGIIGTIMGHEVNHGFDNSGHLYDKNGDIVEWLSAMTEAYGKRAQCFVEQFNKYSIDKMPNYKLKNYGNQTVGENIADTMGLEAAFKAYQRRERECGKPNTVLPGHENLTNDQLFFLSFANLWCEAETTIGEVKTDKHSPGRLRVIGAVSNSEDFTKAYNCPVNSAMNPKIKCHIWK